MIWDRYDDAMDDIDRDIRDERAIIRELEAKIRKLGGEVPKWNKPTDKSAKDHNEMYQQHYSKSLDYGYRRQELQKLVAQLEGKQP